jgi:hypothetical protein
MGKKFFIFSLLLGLLFGCDDADVKPVAGLDGLDGIYIHLEYTYGLGLEIYYRPYILFKDETIYKDLDIDPDEFDPAKSKVSEKDNWGTWKKTGSEITVNWNDGSSSVWEDETWYPTTAPKLNEELDGIYRSLSGLTDLYVGGNSTVVSAKSLAFNDDKFTYDVTSGASSSPVVVYTSETKGGKYRLDINTIELTFNNGEKLKRFFFFTPDSKKAFCIGTTYYLQR